MIISPTLCFDLGERPVHLDVKDKKSLLAISKNAHLPVSELARKVRLSRDSVAYRLEKMRKKSILPYALTLVDVTCLGYDPYHLFIKLGNLSHEREKKIIQTISA